MVAFQDMTNGLIMTSGHIISTRIVFGPSGSVQITSRSNIPVFIFPAFSALLSCPSWYGARRARLTRHRFPDPQAPVRCGRAVHIPIL